MEKKLQQRISNLQNGYGILGSVDVLKSRLGAMSDIELIDTLDEAYSLKTYLNEQDIIDYFKDIVETEEKALRCLQLDDEFISLLEQEVDHRAMCQNLLCYAFA